MNRLYYIYIALVSILLSLLPNSAMAIDSVHEFEVNKYVSITNGLSNNGVTDIFKDSRGYVWIATYDGLNRYNGNSVEIFKNNTREKILPTNRTRAIAEDVLGHIWIGTDRGVVVYDYNSDSFIDGELFGKGGIVRQIFIKDNLIYCISESNGILIYDQELNFVACDKYDENALFSECVLFGDALLIASVKGIVEYSLEQHTFTLHSHLDLGHANSIALLDAQTLLVGRDKGVNEYSLSRVKGALNITFKANFCKDLAVKSVYADRQGDVWVGTTFGGVFHFPNYATQNGYYETYLSHKRICSFLELASGNVLVATFDDGVYSLTERQEPIFKSPHNQPPLNMPLIVPIDEDRVLVRSNRTIYIYNCTTECFEPFPTKLSSLFQRTGGSFILDKNNLLWLICAGGCYTYNFNTDHINKVDDPKLLSLKAEVPRSLTLDMAGNIWVGYLDNLFRISLDNRGGIDRVESIYRNSYFENREIKRVRIIYSDATTNSIWFGTDLQGLYVINLNGATNLAEVKVSHYDNHQDDPESLSSNFVSSILRDNSGTMWVGTEQGGLCRVNENPEGLTFRAFTEEDGLSNNVVKALQCDMQGRLWIATNIGLNSFDLKREQFRTYRMSDGLPIEEYWFSTTKNKRGQLLFTSSSSICYFDPQQTPNSEELPRLYFNGLKIYNRAVKPNVPFDGKVILKEQLTSGDAISLSHNKNTFSVGVDAIYPQSSSYHHYHYILEPINSQWTTSHVSNSDITFNGLKPGRYTLRVKASNSYGDMTSEQQLHIRINRPFYSSVVAYLIYFILLSSAIILVVYFMMHTQSLRHSLSLEAQEKEYLKQTNEEKQRYFSNISHELKTPLTLIAAPLSILADRFKLDVNILHNLEIMQRQVRKMLQIIDLAHGIQLKDNNLLELKCETFVVRDFLKDISKDFDFLARFDKKSFKVEYPDSILSVNADRNMMEKVLNNLLNNAFKYTSSGDEVVLSYHADGQTLTLSVSDNGSGISQKDLPHIFERYYTSKSIETKKVGGTGIGLAFSKHIIEMHGGTVRVESQYGQGTSFIVEMPIIVNQCSTNDYPTQEDPFEQHSIIHGSPDDDIQIEVDQALREKLVYIVEDNGEMRSFISDIVARYFAVKAFSSAAECLAAMEEQWPDVLVSDIMMPDMTGDKLCEMIKSDIRTSHIPVILLTALDTVDDRIKGIEIGADSYIGKPFYPKHLITRISALLRNRMQLFDHFQKGHSFKQSSVGGVSSRDAEILSSLYALFEQKLDDEMIELDSLAIELGLNRTLFYSKIKALTDMSPYELLKNYRLQRAMELLRSGEHNVNEVCDMTGFKSRTHFSRVFKQHFGITPSKVSSEG